MPQNTITENILRWQPLACLELFCEIQSPVASIIKRAEALFGAYDSTPDPVTFSGLNSSQTLRWHVTFGESFEESTDLDKARPWRVENLDTHTIHYFKNEQSALTTIEYSIVQALVDQTKVIPDDDDPDAIFALHGALLSKDGFGVIVVGPKEAGKSTLSCALWQHGWALLSDDFCFLRGANHAYPAARRVSLRNGSRELLGEEVWSAVQNAPSSSPSAFGWLFHPHEVEAKYRPGYEGIQVQAFIFLGRRTSEATSALLQKHNPALAALALLPYCTLLPQIEPDEAAPEASAGIGELDWGVGLPRITPVTSRVPVYDLGRGPLAEMVAAVETLLPETSPVETLPLEHLSAEALKGHL